MLNETIRKIREGGYSATEIKLMAVCLVLLGLVIGLVIAPAKFFIAGSFNSNGNGNSGCISTPEEFAEMLKKITDKKASK